MSPDSADRSADRSAEALFCGCWGEVGHATYRFVCPGRCEGERASHPRGAPWKNLDSNALQAPFMKQSVGYLHHLDGWTALSFHDFTVDTRPGSHATFAFNETLAFDEALGRAREKFPHIVARLEAARPLTEFMS